MSNEKLKILKMLEEGKINASEASRLLESISVPGYKSSGPGYGTSGPGYGGEVSNNGNGTPPRGRQKNDFESFTTDLGKKFDTFVKDMEPKIQKFTDVVVEKTAVTADKISKTFTPPPEKKWQSATYSAPVNTGRGIDKNIELKVAGSGNLLNISGFKGQVLIKGYNGDNISAVINYSPKSPHVSPELMILGSKYFLSYEEDWFNHVSIDAFVPEFMFDSVNVSNTGGGICVSGINAGSIDVSADDGNMEVRNLDSKNLRIESSNGNLRLENIAAVNAQIECFNGAVSGDFIDVRQLEMNAFNGGVSMNIAHFSRFDEYMWNVESNNGRMLLNLPGMPGLGYHVKAVAALNSVKIGLGGLNYIKNDRSYAEAKSIGFDTCPKKVRMSLETSNAPLTVN